MKSSIQSSVDQRGVAALTINRPEKRNAFDDTVIAELTEQLVEWNNNAEVRVVVLTGEGDVFSSGADLAWMKSMAEFDETANNQDSLKLAELMHQLYGMHKPTIARINGNAFGGALGLLACCDIAIAVNNANFSFSEVKLGIVPAVISPFVVEAIGLRQARKLFLSGERFTANDAHRSKSLSVFERREIYCE